MNMTIHSFKVFHPRNAIDAPQKMRVIAHLIVFKSYMCGIMHERH